ncbi:efflux RND transporter permease subunit [Lacunimicrobium album]
MGIAHFFIDRPIFATVLSVVMMIVGSIAYLVLPSSQYPDVVPPTIVVRASYPGAPPEIIAQTVATPIEQEVNGVEDMLYMSSQCTNDGTMQLTITFKIGTDLDNAQVLVQNRVAVAEPRLPETVRRLGITTKKTSPDLLMVIHLISPDASLDSLYIGNYALIQVRDELARVEGVGDINIFGLREYSMRVWIDPDKLAHLSLTTQELMAAMQEQNIQVASGVLGQPPAPKGSPFQFTVTTLGRLESVEQFGDIIIKRGEAGRIVTVKDVARIELGARDYSTNSYLDSTPAVGIAVLQLPGANAIATAERVIESIQTQSEKFPQGLEHRIVYNPTVFVEESINSVIHTLFEAIILVVIVVLIFLQNWRASVIPLMAIPVSLIGTFAFMQLFGFSLNMLSLFGLVLAIGIVVDDAIVVVENVERHIEHGMTPKAASHKAMDEVTAAVIAIAFGLSAVFVPTAFLSGITGLFFQQFALTIAVSTLLSALVSLTLTPAMCAILLTSREAKKDWFARLWDILFGWFFKLFNKAFDFISHLYAKMVGVVVRFWIFPIALYAALVAMAVIGFYVVPAGFIPAQDKGYLIVAIQLPDSASIERTDAVITKARDLIMDTEGVEHAVVIAGFSGATRANSANAGAIFVVPKSIEERAEHGPSQPQLIGTLQGKMMSIPEAEIFVIPPPPVQGLGTGGGYKFLIQSRGGGTPQELQTITDEFVAKCNQEQSLARVFSTFRASTPQVYANINRVKANMLNVPLDSIFQTLQVNLSSSYVNDFNLFGRTFQVTAQADAPFRIDQQNVTDLKTRNTNGDMVPLGSVLDMQWRTGPDRYVRYNLYQASEIQGDTGLGFSSGDAIATIDRLGRETLPPGYTVEWTDLAYQEKAAGNTAIYIFPLCVLFVFLVHSAEYESWMLPLAIILIAPVALPFALGGIWMRGMDNNLIAQIGFVVLIGLAAKNAVLIVEFAKQLEEQGRSPTEAAVESCRLRLRPIMMTSFAFILGVVPLAIATGPGFEMRQVLGTAVFFGMLGVTFMGLFLTPTFYVLLRHISLWINPNSVFHAHGGAAERTDIADEKGTATHH